MNFYAGIDIGGGSLKGSLITKEGIIENEFSLPTNKYCSNNEYIDSVKEVIQELIRNKKADAIGIGSPGPLDLERGIVIHSTNLPNLNHTPLAFEIKKEFRVPVYLNNDANCAALGEYHFGKLKKDHSLSVLTLGTGLGGGWVYHGRIFNGYQGNGMEAGHLTIVKDGAICGCGKKGCAESYFSATGLLARYHEMTGKDLSTVEELFKMAISGDITAKNVVFLGTDVLADLIKNIIHLINPDRIALVGGITKSWDFFSERLINRVKENIFPVFADHVVIEKGEGVSGSLGAAALCFNERSF